MIPRRAVRGTSRARRSARVGSRSVAGSIAHDASHRASCARGAAYFHMVADPWDARPVRGASLLPVETALLRSQTRIGMTADGANGANILIRVSPGLGTAPSGTVWDNTNAKIQWASWDPVNGDVIKAPTFIPDQRAVQLYDAVSQYRPLAMGVRIITTTREDDVAGCAFVKITPNTYYGTDPTDLTNAYAAQIANDPEAVLLAWNSSREISAVWQPLDQDNFEFTRPSDIGPDVHDATFTAPSSLSINKTNHQRTPYLEFYIQAGTDAAVNYQVQVVTIYEVIPRSDWNDILDVDMAHVAAADVSAARAQVAGSSGQLVLNPQRVSNGLRDRGFGRVVADAAIDAYGSASGVVGAVATAAAWPARTISSVSGRAVKRSRAGD